MSIKLNKITSTSIYSTYPTLDAGKDQILDLFATIDNDNIRQESRILLKLNNAPDDGRLFCDFRIAKISNVKQINTIIEYYPITSDWDEGTNTYSNYSDNPIIPYGASWNKSTGITDWSSIGGDYDVALKKEIIVNNLDETIRLDLTDFITYWNSHSNYGVLIKFKDDVNTGNIKLYSEDSHTDYKPIVYELTDDVPSADIEIIDNDDWENYFIFSNNLQKEYKVDTINNISIRVRTKYPTKTFLNDAPLFNYYNVSKDTKISIYNLTSDTTFVPEFNETNIVYNNQISQFTLDTTNFIVDSKYKIYVNINNKLFASIGEFIMRK